VAAKGVGILFQG